MVPAFWTDTEHDTVQMRFFRSQGKNEPLVYEIWSKMNAVNIETFFQERIEWYVTQFYKGFQHGPLMQECQGSIIFIAPLRARKKCRRFCLLDVQWTHHLEIAADFLFCDGQCDICAWIGQGDEDIRSPIYCYPTFFFRSQVDIRSLSCPQYWLQYLLYGGSWNGESFSKITRFICFFPLFFTSVKNRIRWQGACVKIDEKCYNIIILPVSGNFVMWTTVQRISRPFSERRQQFGYPGDFLLQRYPPEKTFFIY